MYSNKCSDYKDKECSNSKREKWVITRFILGILIWIPIVIGLGTIGNI